MTIASRTVRSLRFALPWLMAILSAAVQAESAHTQQLADFQSQAYLTGIATHPETGALLYTETWDDAPGGDAATIRYWSPDGGAIAFKTLDFSGSAFAPKVFQANFLNLRGFEVSRAGDEIAVRKLRLSAEAPLEAPVRGRATPVEFDEKVVVDAGFDRYVLAQWDRLVSGRSVRFDFLQVDKARLIPLKIKPKKCAAGFSIEVRCFSLNIDNLLLSRFVKPITLVYDAQKKRLLRYKGLGQLTGSDGKGLVVQIDYRYRDQP